MKTSGNNMAHKIKVLGVLLFIIFGLLSSTFSTAQTGPCYIFESSTGHTYDTLTGTPIPLYVGDVEYTASDEGLSQAIPIGFTFIYNFQPYTEFKACANGFITLDTLSWNDELWWNYLKSSYRKLIIAPLWDDLIINSGGNIRYDLTGTEGSRILKIEFNNLSFFLGGNFHLKFQVWLYEGTNEIEFRYGDDDSTNKWYNYTDEGISIGLNDERDTSFMSITPGVEPTYSLTVDNDLISSEQYVVDGLKYKFTPAARWVGNNNSDWITESNWDKDTIPSGTDHAIIPQGTLNNPIINMSGAQCKNLLIEPGSELTIDGGGELTINGDLKNDGNLSITSSSETSLGSLIIHGNTDTVTFKPYLTGGSNWHLISSPVVGQDIWSWASASENNIAISSSEYAITTYIEGNNDWDDYPVADQNEEFEMGTGYSTLRSSNGTVTMSGVANTSDKTNIPLTRLNQGWNLLGNPFTSAIGANNSASSTNHLLSTENVANLDESYAGLYLWDPNSGTEGEYVIINNSGGTPQNYIQAGQGFFVRPKDNTSRSFDITKDMQAHQSGIPFKSVENSWPTIKIMASDGKKSSSSFVRFNANMTNGLDVSYDAGMFKANSEFALYTKLIEDNGVDFSIQCLPDLYDDLIVPVGLDAAEGTEVVISAELYDLPSYCDPYLEDRIKNRFISLAENNNYTLTMSEQYKGTGALFLHTSNNHVTATSIIKENDPFKVIPFADRGYVEVVSASDENCNIKIYDLSGRVHAVNEIYKGINKIELSRNSGVYLIHISNQTQLFSQKFIWHKN